MDFCDAPASVENAVFRLGAADSHVTVSLVGGTLLGWDHHGQSMLRSRPAAIPDSQDPFDSASFPLVPYSNRIAHGNFVWNDHPVGLRPNFAPEPHAIHGVGWRARWTVDTITHSSAVISLHHAGNPDWPWPFRATQRITLCGGVLSLELEARNLADQAVPLAFGHHPYFEAKGATLGFSADTVWTNSAAHLPDRRRIPTGDFDFTHGAPVAGRNVDNCYEGWDGFAEIAWDGLPWQISLSASASLPCAVIYIPLNERFFCFEPVPHTNNAINLPGAAPVPVIGAGDCFTSAIRLAAHGA